MNCITSSAPARKVVVVSHPKSSLDLRRYRRRWIQSRFGLSAELASVVADLAFANRWGRL